MTQGVALGRGACPSFGGMISGIPIVRFTAAGAAFITGTGFGLYGSTSYVRAFIVACGPPSIADPTTRAINETSTAGRGWSTTAVASTRQMRYRHYTGGGVLTSPGVVTLRQWPLLSIVVTTWDAATYKSYLNGALVVSQGIATGITAASSTLDTLTVWQADPPYWLAHFLGSDGAGAFMNDAQVAAWSTSVLTQIRKNQPIIPWSGCERWWDAGAVAKDRRTWFDSIGGVVATSTTPCEIANVAKAAIYF